MIRRQEPGLEDRPRPAEPCAEAQLGGLGATGLIGIGFGIGALACGAHISLDHTLGYGLHTPDGYQRR